MGLEIIIVYNVVFPRIFTNPRNLKINLIQTLRIRRNSAAHPGQTKSKQEAENYILIAKEFLSRWISQKI